MLFYLSILLFICICAFSLNILYSNQRNRDKIFIGIVGTFLFLLYFLKAETVGTDYPVYIDFFDSCPWLNYGDFFESIYDLSGFEKGYVLLNKIVSDICPYHIALNFVLALFFSLSSCFLLKKYVRPLWMGFFLLMALGIYTNGFNIVRQSLAMFICWMSIKFILERRLFMFLLFITIAFSFHKTALIFFPLYFIGRIKLNSKLIVLGIMGGLVIGRLINVLMGYVTLILQANNYLDDTSSGGVTKFLFFLFSFGLIYYVLSKRGCLENKNIVLFVNMLFFMLLIQSIALQFSILTRVTDYFIFSLCILYPMIVTDKVWGKNGALVRFLFIIFFLCFFYATNKANLYGIIPYHLVDL